MSANIHHTPIIMRVASVVYGTSPPAEKRPAEKKVGFKQSDGSCWFPPGGGEKSAQPTKIISGFTNLIFKTHRNCAGGGEPKENAILRQPLQAAAHICRTSALILDDQTEISVNAGCRHISPSPAATRLLRQIKKM